MTSPDAPSRIKSILIVEDDQDIRETLEDALALEGYSVQTAANGTEALKVLEASDHPCLILLDLMMPVMSGWEFLKIQEKDVRIAPIPVVVVSAGGSSRSIESKKFLRKPVDLDVLSRVVQHYCG